MVYSSCVLGTRINNYELTRRIDEGSMGTVYEAVHTLIDRRFAIKVLRKRFRDQIDQTEQFLREARMGLKLRHPNIVSIYDFGETADGLVYLASCFPPPTPADSYAYPPGYGPTTPPRPGPTNYTPTPPPPAYA